MKSSLPTSHNSSARLTHPSPPEHPISSSPPAALGRRLSPLSWPGKDPQEVAQVSASPLGQLPRSPRLTARPRDHESLHSAAVVHLKGFPPGRLSAV